MFKVILIEIFFEKIELHFLSMSKSIWKDKLLDFVKNNQFMAMALSA